METFFVSDIFFNKERSMDVKIKPLNGCLAIILAVFTLGVAPLAIWISERSWPKKLDEQGLVTRGGMRIAWNEFTKAVKVLTRVTSGSSSTIEHYELSHPKGKVKVVVYRLENGPQVFEYIWTHLPDQAKFQPQ
jgi:hypothetical protein